MSEAEFDRLLDMVRDAIAADLAPDHGQDLGEDKMFVSLAQLPLFRSPSKRKAANDNGKVWPLIPFPEGWYATC
jgi:hypothetical protein